MDNLAQLGAKALKNIQKLAWPKGARVYCGLCLKEKTKTPEQMEVLLKKWPRCCGHPIEVRPL